MFRIFHSAARFSCLHVLFLHVSVLFPSWCVFFYIRFMSHAPGDEEFVILNDGSRDSHIFHQSGKAAFNRATLLNVGFLEARRINPSIKCFVFHDVDKIPLKHIYYNCTNVPKHLYTAGFQYNHTIG